MMIYDNVIPSENCKKIIELFEKSKHQIETFETGRKEYTEIDIDKFDIPWFETKQMFISMMKVYMHKFMKDLNIKEKDFPPIIDMENIRIKNIYLTIKMNLKHTLIYYVLFQQNVF